MFFNGSFFKGILYPFAYQISKIPVSAIKTQIDDNGPTILLARWATNAEGSLPVAITARIWQSGRPLMSNPDSCKSVSKSDQRFLRRKILKNFFMSV